MPGPTAPVPVAPATTSTLPGWLADAARIRERRGTTRHTRVVETGVVDFAGNDYLDLSRHPDVIAAAVAATERHGAGARASRVVTGTLDVHANLEAALRQLTGQESALAFSSGYTANLGVLSALSGPDTLIVLDAHMHASAIDGARASRSPVTTYPHRDLEALNSVLAQRTQRRAVVAVESVYSVLGDATDLVATAEVCRRHGAVLVVDEAHGIGVLGGGRGAVHAAGLHDDPDVIVTATLSKALGAMGGAVLGTAALRDHLLNSARSFLFDTGLAPAPAAAATAACAVVQAEPERVARLHDVAARLAAELGVEQSAGAVQSVPMPSAEIAYDISQRLRHSGVHVGCFRPPSVPDGVSRLRFTAHSDATESEVALAGRLLREALHETAAYAVRPATAGTVA
ncbi:8-amino-7-oxononanoate synthase [Knoellia subterranea]|uniref:8-amino-7-oxononanoate synthase n=1 Tax=Knoellia subterranea KCTC 19937 TaxID=1385521 RepID=A0A0A0JJH1_9MICO|nr:8-amino-7-oxononanoate synthase [Knoellia subterranea]KGN37525.1 8-amino-7-oxononanoate synthase [Knoellia subterranea KCTC 19937]